MCGCSLYIVAKYLIISIFLYNFHTLFIIAYVRCQSSIQKCLCNIQNTADVLIYMQIHYDTNFKSNI